MPLFIPIRTSRRKARFSSKRSVNDRRHVKSKPRNMSTAASSDLASTSSIADTLEDIEIVRDLRPIATIATPAWFTDSPPIQDELQTETSKVREETGRKCLPFLQNKDTNNSSDFNKNSFGIPALQKEGHVEFLHGYLADFPAQFVSLDASRPWLFYWCLAGLSFLGQDISEYRER